MKLERIDPHPAGVFAEMFRCEACGLAEKIIGTPRNVRA
jgi:hypothetical protein